MTDEIAIVPFADGDAAAFAALNRAWLVGHDLLEPTDEAQLAAPEAYVLARGGAIFMARGGGRALGCCAAIPVDAGTFEIAKLAVDPSARGAGLGRALVLAALRFGAARGGRKAILTSSTRLGPALKLYESLGFRYAPMPADVIYETADVYMELELADLAKLENQGLR